MTRLNEDRLRKAGWKVGNAQDFLDLSDEEAALIELRLALARRLRAERESQGLTQADVAKRVRSSQSRVAKMEAGDASVSTDLLLRSLVFLGVSFQELAAVFAKLPEAKPARRARPARSKRGVARRK
ncbi:MAG: transcriptional regulator [Planctomycetota bacterium]|nr:MAG: transcriptional regulator [Planctomycetota bacterium]